MKNTKINKFSLFLLSIFLLSGYIYTQQCIDIVFLEYLKQYFFDFGKSEGVTYQVQFVNEGTQNRHCYFTLKDKYFDVYENKYLYYTYFPRTARVIFNQFVIFFITSLVLINKNKIFQNSKKILLIKISMIQ